MSFPAHQLLSFNPLNQVYVFNWQTQRQRIAGTQTAGFNPLNQVYVFNLYYLAPIDVIKLRVLIP